MAGKKTINATADFQDVILGIDKWAKKNLELAASQDVVITATKKLTKEGEVVIGTIKGLNAAGEEQVTTIKKMGIAWNSIAQTSRVVVSATDEQTAALKRNATAQEQVAAATSKRAQQQAAAVRGFVSQSLNLPAQGVSSKTVFNIKNQVGQLAELVRANKVSASKVITIWKEAANGQFRAYEGANRRIQQQIVRIQETQRKAVNEFNSSVKSRFEKTAQAGTKAATGAKNFQKATEGAKKSAEGLLISWQSIGRIIAGQVIRRAFLAFIQQVREAVDVADDFLIKIGEVRTISQNNQLSTDEWAKGLRNLSDAFGIPLLDQTEAAYQALSNQIAEGAESFKILEEANKLALATVSDSSQSINALTAILNSYGLGASQADEVSGQLFKTIELGRIRLNEISNTIGTVTALAAELSIDFSSISAALATLTIRGIKANQAMTQIRGVLAKLIKPSTEMKNLFREMGVTSGEELIRSLGGLEGFLEKLATTTDGNTTELGKYISRLRGLSGAAILTSKEGLSQFRKSLDEITNSTESFDAAVIITTENIGKKFQIQLNKSKNIFINDFGVPIVKTVVAISDKIGGLDAIVKALATSITVVLVPAVGILTAILLKAALLNPFGAVLTGLGLLAVAATLAFDKIAERNRRYTEELKAEEEKRQKLIAENVSKTIEGATQGIDRLLNQTIKVFSGFRKRINDSTDGILAGFKELEPGLKTIFSNITKSATALVSDINGNVKKIQSDIKSALEEIDRISTSTGAELFQLSIADLDVDKQINRIQDELDGTIRRAIGLVGTGQFDLLKDRLKEGEKLFSQLRKTQEKAGAENEKNIKKRGDLEAKIAKSSVDTLIKISKLESKLNDTKEGKDRRKIEASIAALRAKSISDANSLERKLKQIKDIDFERVDLAKTIVDFEQQRITILRAEILANRRREEEEKVRLKAAKELQDRVTETAKRVAAFDVKDFLDLKTIEDINALLKDRTARIGSLITLSQDARLQDKLSADQIKDLVTLQQQFNDIATDKKATLNIKDRLKSETKEIELLKERIKALGDERIALESIRTIPVKNIDTLVESLEGLDLRKEFTEDLVKNLKVAREALAEGLVTKEASNSVIELRKQLQTLGIDFQSVAAKLSAGKPIASIGGQVKDVEKNSSAILRAIQRGTGVFEDSRAEFLDITRVVLALNNELREGGNALQRNAELFFAQNQLDQSLQNIANSYKDIDEKTKKSTDGTDKLKDSVDLVNDSWIKVTTTVDGLTEKIDKQAKALGSLAAAINAAAEAEQRLQPNKLATGGIVRHLASGGSVGTDTVPAMLSPGEFVVNARSSRKFFSQLVAMNSNGASRFENGGQVTNVGDVNVSMTSSGNKSVDVVQFGKLLRREIRRGTVKL